MRHFPQLGKHCSPRELPLSVTASLQLPEYVHSSVRSISVTGVCCSMAAACCQARSHARCAGTESLRRHPQRLDIKAGACLQEGHLFILEHRPSPHD